MLCTSIFRNPWKLSEQLWDSSLLFGSHWNVFGMIRKSLGGVCVWGGEDTPWYKLYRYVQPQRVGFLCRFGLKIGIDFAHVCLESGMVFKGTTGVYECIYCFYSKTVRKKVKYVNLKWILRILFCWRSNLSNNDIISQRPGLETGVKMTFLVWNRVRIWRTRQHTPTKISKRAPISQEK